LSTTTADSKKKFLLLVTYGTGYADAQFPPERNIVMSGAVAAAPGKTETPASLSMKRHVL
jgi:hypothetical protein